MSQIQKLRQKAVKFQNLEEHSRQISRTIKSEVQLQNDYLEKINSLDTLLNEVKGKVALLDKEKEQLTIREKELVSQTEALTEKESLFLVSKEIFEKYKEDELRTIEQRHGESKRLLQNATLEAENIDKATKTQKEELNALERQFDANKALYRAELDALVGKISDAVSKISTLGQKETLLTKELEHLNQKIKESDDIFAATFDKEATFLYNLEQKDKEIKGKEKSMLVHAARLKALYKRDFDKEIKI